MPAAGAGQTQRAGQIVTFYSFKGGTGRTMALANVAWILAANGKRVLIADWDLESPGLHRFFQPFMDPAISHQPGVVDFIRRYEWAAREAEERIDDLDLGDAQREQSLQAAMAPLISEHVNQVDRYAIPVGWHFPDNGAIDFLTPGRQDNGVYEHTLSALDWDNLYDHLSGGVFFDTLRAKLKNTYDYVLIDSRTGLSDIADICTLHLPDTVVDCFTLSTQGIEGAAKIAGQIQRDSERDITIYPVPMRIDPTQHANVVAGLQMAAGLFKGLPADLPPRDRERYWDEIKVPYLSAYAYEETLAPFGDRPGDDNSLLAAYQRIAALITRDEVTALPPLEEWRRLRTQLQFTRSSQQYPLPKVVIEFSPQDQLWAEWIVAVLAGAGVYARLAPEGAAEPGGPATGERVIAVASEFYFAALEMRGGAPETLPETLVCVTEVRVPSGSPFDEMQVLFLADLSEEAAVDSLTERFGERRPAGYQRTAGSLRYPGGGWNQVANVPARNVNFTGRDAALLAIREQLHSRPRAAFYPLTVRGVGGVGKTQVALEYAQRFKSDYDVVWWINCAQSQYIDALITDLGTQLRNLFGISLPAEGAEAANQVLDYLSSQSQLRWLLVYDNAEDEDRDTIERLLPRGGGHILITSRHDLLPGQGKIMPLSVFERTESVDHLRRRIPGIPQAEASELAATLGDVPLAMATAGALLATENMTVSAYLALLDQQQDQQVHQSPDDFPEAVTKAWHLSLDRLALRSPAAAQLLGICSVMAPVSSFDLVVSDVMVEAVQELEPDITDRSMINLLIGQIDQLALIKVDQSARQMQVHQVVQEVVRQRLQDTGQIESARQQVHQMLVAARPKGDVDDPAMWPGYRIIWPHLTPSQAHGSPRQQVQDLLVDRVRYLWQRYDLERGVRRAEEIQDAWQAMLSGQEESGSSRLLRRQLYRLQYNLANILRGLGRYDESRTLDEAVLRGQEKLLGQEHQHTLQTRMSLGADLRALGDYQNALDYDLETYKLWVEKSGFNAEYHLALNAAHNLALSYLLNGDSRQAIRYDLQTLERRTRVYANARSHPRMLNSRSAVGRDMLEAGRYQESVRFAQEVLAQAHEAYGNNDRITLNAHLWLGVAQRCAGDPHEAEVNIEAAVDGLSRIFGRESGEALTARLSQALNNLALGQIKDGRATAEELLAVYKGRLSADHPHALICQLNVATAKCLEDEYAAARDDTVAAVEGLENRVGADHPYTLAAKLVLASVLARTGDLPSAERLEHQVEMARVDVLGPQHPDTLRCRANLLLTRAELGAGNDTATERRAVIRELSAQLGADHPDVRTAADDRRLLCVIDPQPF